MQVYYLGLRFDEALSDFLDEMERCGEVLGRGWCFCLDMVLWRKEHVEIGDKGVRLPFKNRLDFRHNCLRGDAGNRNK